MSVATRRITDRFPSVSALGRAFGFEIGFRQLDGGDPSIPATGLVSENITLTHMCFARRFHQLGLPPARRLSFGIPVTGMRDWFGSRYRASSILPFHQAGGIDGVSDGGFEAYTISFSEGYLSDSAAALKVPVPNRFLHPRPETTLDHDESVNHIRILLRRIFRNPGPGLDSKSEDELMVTLLRAGQNAAAVIDRSAPKTRDRAIREALDYIAEHRYEVITVKEICSACNVALRTLNRAFKERFGISPNTYLKQQRLSAVRDDLLLGPPGTQVSDIANRWGFWHMGQFAGDYRRLFGELPSITLRK